MQRLNITVPDALYERLERVRDRVNASKICSQALEREIDMIESKPAIADPDVQKLLERLQSSADRWRDRGKQDGRKWAIEVATRDELITVARGRSSFEWPSSFSGSGIGAWAAKDAEVELVAWDAAHPSMPGEDEGEAASKRRRIQHEQLRGGEQYMIRTQIEAKADREAYEKGWREAVAEVWALVSGSLQL